MILQLLPRFLAPCCVIGSLISSFAPDSDAQVVFDNGGSNTLSAANGDPLQAAIVRNSTGGLATTLNVVAGASIGTTGGGTVSGGVEVSNNPVSVKLEGDSVLNYSGGARATGDLFAADNSVATLSVLAFDDAVLKNNSRLNLVPGGRIDDDIVFLDNSHLEMTGGRLDDEVEIRNSATANFSGGVINDDLVVVNNAVVNISSLQIDDDIEAAGDSVTNVSGGTFGGVVAAERSVVNITGGTFSQPINPVQGGTVNLRGGTLAAADGEEITAALNAKVLLDGVTAGALDIGVRNAASLKIDNFNAGPLTISSFLGSVEITGGVSPFLDLFAEANSVANIRGGDFAGGDLEAATGSRIRLLGTSFLVNGANIGFGVVPFVAGRITGVLADGNDINFAFRRQFTPVGQAAVIELVNVPEPRAELVAFVLVGGLLVMFRRQ